MRALRMAVTVCVLLWGSIASATVPMYTIVTPAEPTTVFRDIDQDTNKVVGIFDGQAAQVYPAVSPLAGLQVLGPVAFSQLATIAGEVLAGTVRLTDPDAEAIPFAVRPGEGVVNLLSPGFDTGQALGSNASGRVVGTLRQILPALPRPRNRRIVAAVSDSGPFQPLSDLGTLPSRFSVARAVNADGVIVGDAFGDDLQQHPVVWPTTGGVQILAGGQLSPGMAWDINTAGAVIISGGVRLPCATEGWYLAPDGTTIIPLPPLPGHTHGVPHALNDAGLVVGISVRYDASCTVQPAIATIWEGGAVSPLETHCTNCTGWQLLDATAINDDGLIVGQGIHEGVLRSFVLIPEPVTATPEPSRVPKARKPKAKEDKRR